MQKIKHEKADLDFITENLGGCPVNQSIVWVDSIYHQCSTSTNEIDGIVGHFLWSSCFYLCTRAEYHLVIEKERTYDDIEAIGICLLELCPLRFRVGSIKFDVFIGATKILSDLCLDAFVGCNDDLRSTVQFEELSKNKTCSICETLTLLYDRRLPVGPAPRIRASTPTGAFSLSSPCIAHDAGSTSVASSSVRLTILYTFLLWLWQNRQILGEKTEKQAHTTTYSANPPGRVTPRLSKFSQSNDWPRRQ